MATKSVIYAANTTAQSTLAAGTTINFGTIVRKNCCNLNLSGGNVEVSGAGYYDLDVNLTVVPATAGTILVQVYNDGVAVPGAEASLTVTASEIYSLTIPAVIRETCNCEKTITVVVSGEVSSVTNAAILVEKL